VIEKVIRLKKDAAEQRQFFELTIKYDAVGAPAETTVYGSEPDLREVLRDGGLATVDIEQLFANART
jgi:hypothetical protein